MVVDSDGKLFTFLDTLAGMDGAIKRRKHVKVIHSDRTKQEFILTFDESKRMLVFCAATEVVINFVFPVHG